jgi:hypothetical protein
MLPISSFYPLRPTGLLRHVTLVARSPDSRRTIHTCWIRRERYYETCLWDGDNSRVLATYDHWWQAWRGHRRERKQVRS